MARLTQQDKDRELNRLLNEHRPRVLLPHKAECSCHTCPVHSVSEMGLWTPRDIKTERTERAFEHAAETMRQSWQSQFMGTWPAALPDDLKYVSPEIDSFSPKRSPWIERTQPPPWSK